MRPGNTIAGFRFVREVGRGGRAVVWEAVDTRTGDTVALKVLDAPIAGAPQRLRLEYASQTKLVHDNIVRAHDLVEIEDRLALVTELVRGPSLRQWLKVNRPDAGHALVIFGGILRGLRAAHEAGLVHRDLTPANILMAPGRRGPTPKLADFGLVKADGAPSITQSGLVLGTLRYMPPEQLNDPSGVDARADLFSAGCILFELCTGTRCFDAPNKVAVMNAIRKGDHTPFPDDLDPEVRRVIEVLIDPDPEKRLTSADAVLDALGLPHSYTESDSAALAGENKSWIAVSAVLAGGVLMLAALGFALVR